MLLNTLQFLTVYCSFLCTYEVSGIYYWKEPPERQRGWCGDRAVTALEFKFSIMLVAESPSNITSEFSDLNILS